MATAQRTKNTIVLEQDVEATVTVERPLPPLPEGMRTFWGSSRISRGRTHFNPLRLSQDVRVSYTLTQDQGMLEDLKLRARRNANGTSQRGPASATPTEAKVKLDGVPSMVRHAANLAGLKITDGPLVVKVKLLERPAEAPLVCVHCKQPVEAHEHVTEASSGLWVGGRTYGAHYEADAPRTDHYWFCQTEPVS